MGVGLVLVLVLVFSKFLAILGQCPSGRCVRKCCPNEQSLNLVNDTSVECIQSDSAKPLNIIRNITPYNIIFGKTCAQNYSKIFLDPKIFDFNLEESTGDVIWENLKFNHETACVDSYKGDFAAIACVKGDDEQKIIVAVTGINY